MDSVVAISRQSVTTVHVGTSIVSYPDVLSSGYQSDELETPLSEDPPKRPPRVRFRSRVRITSGLHQHRYRSNSEQNCASLTPSSSTSGSPSSSISAPLRTQAEDEASKPGWGTLGQRVSILAQRNADRRLKVRQRQESLAALTSQRGVPGDNCGLVANERTPLTSSVLASSYLRGEMIDPDVVETEAEMFSREIDLVFGSWPNRLLNHQWWWWHVEPLVCCQCLTESDEEE